MEEYMTKTREGYGSGIARPMIEEKDQYKLNGQFLKELHDYTFSGSNNEDANEHIEKEVISFYKGLDVPTRQILDSKSAIPSMKAADTKKAIQDIADHSQKWHNGTSTRYRSTKTSDGLAAIQAQLNNLGKIKKVNEKVNQGASITALEIQIEQMNKVLRERGSGNLPSLTESNPRDHVNSISTIVETDTTPICRIGPNRYAVSGLQNKEGSYGIKDLDAHSIGTTLLEDALPPKEKDPGSFILPCYINNLCFNKALANLGASISVMPFSTYTNLGLGKLAPTKLIVELADRTVKHPKGIAENILVGIDKFVFPVDFIFLDMPEDIKTPLILGRPCLSTAHAKINVFKRKITLRVGNDKVVFKSEKPT
ncbi:DNA/RNA polymerases superfamily protein [Tanacetum coccineum]|uniref:DNA/RNA polymerases superfamily protein n=1 Tax=Tanacetum coccineum TaxID=301880 RepID=A0ABQ4WJC0_9ASTR